MQDGTTTTARRNRVPLGATLLACALGVTASLAAPPPAAVPAPPAQQELAGIARATPNPPPTLRPAMAEHLEPTLQPIPFRTGSASLTPSATRILDGLGRRLAGERLRVEGHATDDRDLAARRAEAVAAYLAQNCGVALERVAVAVATRADRLVLVVDLGR